MRGMMQEVTADRARLSALEPSELEAHQLARLNQLLDQVLPHNAFYAAKLADVPRPLRSLEQLDQLPFTYKSELQDTAHADDPARNHSFAWGRYSRLHQTSGTKGRPLTVLDTSADWQWWLSTWQFVLDAAGVTVEDRVLAAFSFGPFIGFWSAFEAAAQRGCLMIPGGGLGTLARIELIRGAGATVLMCTPSYALHLAEVAAQHQIDVGASDVRRIILAGEPGGSIPAIRARIESSWQARVIDHAGATEVGPWGYSVDGAFGLHVVESEFIAEFLSLETGGMAAEGELAEIVLTSLGRTGCPVIRYRTGDLARPHWRHEQAARYVWLDGGIVGRRDDMLVIRGVNVFPTAVEQILRSFPEVIEYRITASKRGEMDQLSVEIEDRLQQPARVAEELRLRLGLKVDVQVVAVGTLPRFEGKGNRFMDCR